MAMKAAAQITDRAKRYRAQKNVTGPRVCVICGAKPKTGTRAGSIDVMHLDGNEAHGEKENLAYGCRSCNGKLAAAFKAIGAGKPTNQYNPSKGVPSFQQYAWAVSNQRHSGEHGEHGAIIHATPKHKRIEYARLIAEKARRTKRERFDERWNPTWNGRPMTQQARDDAYAEEEREEKAAAEHADWVRAQSERNLKRTKRNSGTGKWVVEGVYLQHPEKSKGLAGSYLGRDKALAQARLLADIEGSDISVFSPTGGEMLVQAKRKGKRNPAAASAEVFEEFHGYAPKELVTVKKRVHHHKHLASAGELVGLQVRPIGRRLPVRNIEGLGEAYLCFNESKDQLFIEGGDQSLDRKELKSFGVTADHELQTLGKLVGVGYYTDKKHLGDEGGEATYSHTFRTTNENGRHVVVKIARYPDLIYRVVEQQFEISGGSYTIRAEGIDV